MGCGFIKDVADLTATYWAWSRHGSSRGSASARDSTVVAGLPDFLGFMDHRPLVRTKAGLDTGCLASAMQESIFRRTNTCFTCVSLVEGA